MSKEEISYFIEKLQSINSNQNYKMLGEGREGAIITNGIQAYKIFNKNLDYDYYSLFKQICGKFKKSKRLINIEKIFKIDNYTVISYKHNPSKPYFSGREEEIREFLIECWKNRMVCWDIKPSNFRIFNDGLKLVDYGMDIKPFNWKDFLYMAQRAYLMIKEGDSTDFRKKARKALKRWEFEYLKDFIHFYNSLYEEILEIKNVEYKDSRNPVINSVNMKSLVLRAIEILQSLDISHKDITIYSQSDDIEELGLKIIASLENEDRIEKKYGLILDLVDIQFEELHKTLEIARNLLHNNGHLITIIKNPFFHTHAIKSPLEYIKQEYLKSGYKIDNLLNSDWEVDADDYYTSKYLIVQSSIYENVGKDVSLIIKTCYQDAQMIDTLVKHIVKQCESPDLFLEKIVVLDSKQEKFLRQFSQPDKLLMHKSLEELVKENIIDRYIIAPNDASLIEDYYKRWFNVCCLETHTVKNVPVFAQLFGFENAKGKYVLQIDSDAIIVRRDPNHSFLKDMKLALKKRNDALSISFNIAHDSCSSFEEYMSPKVGMFVPEVRFCLFDKERFFSNRPYPNEVKEGKLCLSWYRSVEKGQQEKNLVSLRGGDPRTFYIHPPNIRKTDLEEWIYILNRAEQSFIPNIQFENIDLTGKILDWKGPKRNESIIFIICGRNVSSRKFLRCWQSVVSQDLRNWGAILIDDNSENNLSDFMHFLSQEFQKRITVVSNHKRQGVLHNIYSAITDYCENPYSTIIILDADDMLLSNHITKNLRRYYTQGIDMTVGTYFRVDKSIPPFVPEFSAPRNRRGGDVWMHLRSFRKYLFDCIKTEDMKMEDEWIDKFTELTYMVPIAEMAIKPLHIKWPIYLYEPTQKRNKEHYRKNKVTIEYIQSKTKYPKSILINYPLKPPGELCKAVSENESNIIFLRHSEKEPNKKEPSLTKDGIELCHITGNNISNKLDLILTTETKRTIETSKHIRVANKAKECELMILKDYSRAYMASLEEREFYKKKFGWLTYLEKWVKGDFNETKINKPEDVVKTLLKEVQSRIKKSNAKHTLVVVHDNTITLLVNFVFNKIITKVDYLNGIILSNKELNQLLNEE